MKTVAVSLALFTLLAVSTAAFAAQAKLAARRIAVTVTSKGFEPASIPLKVGERVVLVVTRTTERTCAKEIVIADRKVRKALPLNHAVEVRYTASKAGAVRFACGMDMVAGELVAE